MRMEYAMKFLSVFFPKSLSTCVAVSTSVMPLEPLLEPSLEASRAQPFRASTANQRVQEGTVTHNLEGLLPGLDQPDAGRPALFLVLEEDGTTGNTEEYWAPGWLSR